MPDSNIIVSVIAIDVPKILTNVSLSLSANEILGIVGESGCGKTTLLKCLMGIVKLQKGEVKFLNKDICSFSKAERQEFRKSIQMVYQDAGGSLNPQLSIRKILQEPLQIHKIPGRHEDKINDILKVFSLAQDCLDKKPGQLSGGEKQRVALARSLILQPKVLLLDESISALDSNIQRSILDMIKSYQQLYQTSVVFISHDLNSVGYLCQRIVVMKDGRIIETQAKKDFFTKPMTTYSKSLIEAML